MADESLCAICQGELVLEVITNCNHRYCARCIFRWYVYDRHDLMTCPTCRTVMTQLHRGLDMEESEDAHTVQQLINVFGQLMDLPAASCAMALRRDLWTGITDLMTANGQEPDEDLLERLD